MELNQAAKEVKRRRNKLFYRSSVAKDYGKIPYVGVADYMYEPMAVKPGDSLEIRPIHAIIQQCRITVTTPINAIDSIRTMPLYYDDADPSY